MRILKQPAALFPGEASARAALVAAVGKHKELQQLVASLKAGEETVSSRLYVARRAHDAASIAATEATAGEAAAIVESLIAGEPATPRKTARQARADLDDAAEHLEQTQAARALLQKRLAETLASLGYAETKARDAAGALVRVCSTDALASYIADSQRVQKQVRDRIAGLQWLHKSNLIDMNDSLRTTIGRLFTPPSAWVLAPDSDIISKWESVVSELCRNPTTSAVLP